jgi:hypothetical protein
VDGIPYLPAVQHAQRQQVEEVDLVHGTVFLMTEEV